MNTAPVLDVRAVSKQFGAVSAVRNVSLTLDAGTITGLLGPNGAGKTTLMRICAGLVRPDAGSVHIAGEVQAPDNLSARACVGVVSADAPPPGELTVAHVLQLQGTLHGLRGAALRAACHTVADDYRLDEFLGRRVRTLSTGMRQRVAIAAAMLHAPRVLLLDEPTVGLDPDVRTHIWERLRALAGRGVSVLLTTHYLEEAARLCSRAHLIVRGALAMSITPETGDGSAVRLERAYLDAVQHEPAPC